MTATWRHLPPAAREIAVAATEAVAAVRRREPAPFDAAVATLAAGNRSGLVLGIVVRLLLERTHPDGLDGEAVRQVLEHAVRSAGEWQPEVDPHVMLVLLAGALGVYDPDDDPTPPTPAALAWHAPLLVADLLPPEQSLADHLTAAFTEIERGERHD